MPDAVKDDPCPSSGSKNFNDINFEEAKNYCCNSKKFWLV